MKKLLVLVFMIAKLALPAQTVFIADTGEITFYSYAPIEDINATCSQVNSIFNSVNGEIAFTLLMKGFIFRKELMQEHFNENYVESDKYPKASFSGSFSGDFSPAKDGLYHVTVKGNLTIHNVTRAIEQPATIEMINGRLSGRADFKIKPEDYNITIPSIVRDKIAADMTVHVRVDCNASQ